MEVLASCKVKCPTSRFSREAARLEVAVEVDSRQDDDGRVNGEIRRYFIGVLKGPCELLLWAMSLS
jgi:hypothetical protein